MKRIIFGGTFDPIHNGHLRIAKALIAKLGGELIFVPSKNPRWKTPLTDAKHRLNMLKIAIKDSDINAEVEEYELNKDDEVNYSIDTVKYLLEKYKDDKFYFAIGADQVNKFHLWKDGDKISKLTQIVYVNRPGFELDYNNIKQFHMLNSEFMESGDISSSEIRDLLKIDTTDGVLRYIEDNELYFVKDMANILETKRLVHSISVARLAVKVNRANDYPLPEPKVYAAAILHDIGKVRDKNNIDGLTCEEYMKKYFNEYIDVPSFAYHQFIGSKIAKDKFGIQDEDILESIKFHATGKANMSLLAMIVYACDKIDPLRDFDSTWLINSCLKDARQGFIDTLIDNKKYLINHNKDIYNRFTKECFEMYIERQ